MEEEKKMAQAKAREISIAAAKAKTRAEASYRKLVFKNNKVCGECSVGAKRVKQKKAEIDVTNKGSSCEENSEK